jgi:hypothetical protein
MNKIEKIRTIEAIASGELDPVQQRQKIWMFKGGEIYRISEPGDLVKSNREHFKNYNGPNDVSFHGRGENIPENTQGQIIESGNPDSLHELAEQYLKLMGKNFKL